MQLRALLSSPSRYRNYRIVLYAGVAILILIAGSMAAVTHVQMYRNAERRIQTYTQSIAKSLELTFRGQIETIDFALKVAAREIPKLATSTRANASGVTQFLEQQRQDLKTVKALRATDEKGNVLYGAGAVNPPINIADRDYFVRLRSEAPGQDLVTSAVLSRIEREWHWVFARRINKPDGRFGGAIIASIPITDLHAMFAELHTGEGVIISLRDPGLKLVARLSSGIFYFPNDDRGVSETFAARLASAPWEGSYSVERSLFDGIGRHYTYERSVKYGFVINVGISNDAAFAEWRQHSITLFIRFFLFTLVLCVAAWLINRTWLRQEAALSALRDSQRSLQEAQQIAHLGSYSYDLQTDTWTSSPVLNGIFGIDSEHPRTAESWLALVAADMRSEMAQYLHGIASSGAVFDREYRITRHRDAQERWVHGRGVFHLDESGKPVLLVGVIQDVTERKLTEAALRENDETLRSLIDANIDGFLRVNEDGRIVDVNQAYSLMSGYAREELLNMRISDLEAVETQREIEQKIQQVFREGHARMESIHRRKDGSTLHIEVSISHRRFPGGQVIAFIRDITARKQAEQALRESEEQFRTIASAAYDAIIMMDGKGCISFWNPAAESIFGYSEKEALGKNLHRMLAPERFHAAFDAGFARFQNSGDGPVIGRKIVLEGRHRDGSEIPIELSLSAVKRNDEWIAIGIVRDISAFKAHEQELQRLANYDPLTGLPNRRLFADRLSQSMTRTRRSGKSLAVCYLDIDDFKPVNDRYGHHAGDQLLIAFSSNLKNVLRADDTVARIGGDEFVLLLNELSHTDEIETVLERVLSAVCASFNIEGSLVNLSASIGVTIFPRDDVDADTLLRHADHAMYRAKEVGKNRYYLFDPERDKLLQAQRHHLLRMRTALDNNEFVLYYQPKVDIVSGDVIGAEALLRWAHPDKGLLMPGTFLHDLDGQALMISLGEWVIDSVLNQIAAWNARGLNIPISVNISADHLLQPDFAERLQLALHRHINVAPSDLELEILETAALSDIKQAAITLNQCRELGVMVSIDDFGTGYSSLTYLRNLPVQILKIDQSFVRDMLGDPSDMGIVVSVIKLARTFNRTVIAEGVENIEQGAKLAFLGCRLMQGYGIARPMPAKELPGWIEHWFEEGIWRSINLINDQPKP